MGEDLKLVGASLSPHQTYGLENNWSRWEDEHAGQLAAIAPEKYGDLDVWPVIADQATDPDNYRSGDAVKHWERYEEDFALAAELGMTALRTGIAWERVQPSPGEIDEAALDDYRTYLETMHDYGLEPVVTLWHNSLPQWFAADGAWVRDDAAEHFSTYVDAVMDAVGDQVTYWVTLNEPMADLRKYGIVTSVADAIGGGPDVLPDGPANGRKENELLGYYPVRKRRVAANMADTHRAAYDIIHDHDPDAMVGTANTVARWWPPDAGPVQRMLGRIGAQWEYGGWVERTIDHIDFFGVNHYTVLDIDVALDMVVPGRETYEYSDMGWPLDYGSLADVIDWIGEKYDLPIIVTEHGVADHTDRKRQELVRQTMDDLEQLQDDHDLRGYLHWSLLDNFEWDKGFWPRWGLIAVDYDNNCERSPRESAEIYADRIQNL